MEQESKAEGIARTASLCSAAVKTFCQLAFQQREYIPSGFQSRCSAFNKCTRRMSVDNICMLLWSAHIEHSYQRWYG